jgi:hypothetical protein
MTGSQPRRLRTRCAKRVSKPADLDQFALNPPGRHNRLPLGGDEDA